MQNSAPLLPLTFKQFTFLNCTVITFYLYLYFLYRCLLNNKAARVMKIIQDIFGLILKFRGQLISQRWQKLNDGAVVHPAFNKMCQTYKLFSEYSRFLFKGKDFDWGSRVKCSQ